MDDALIADDRQRAATIVQVALLREGDQSLGDGTQALGLRLGRLDALMREQGCGEVREHKTLVGRPSAEAGSLCRCRHFLVLQYQTSAARRLGRGFVVVAAEEMSAIESGNAVFE